MAKKYKTWEVMKELSENPKLRFQTVQAKFFDVKICVSADGYINIKRLDINGSRTFEHNVNLVEDEWELIQQPVSFLEAVKANAKGKVIRCEMGKHKYTYLGHWGIGELTDESGKAVSIEEILEGTWHIEEADAE